MFTRQIFSRASQVLAGRGTIAPAFRTNACAVETKQYQGLKPFIGPHGWRKGLDFRPQSLITPASTQTASRCCSYNESTFIRAFSKQASTRNKIPTRSDDVHGPITPPELEPIIDLLKGQIASVVPQMNRIKGVCLGRAGTSHVDVNQGMFALIQLQPEIRAIEQGHKRIQDAFAKWIADDLHDPNRRPSKVMNSRTMYATNRELARLEKTFWSSSLPRAIWRLGQIQKETRRKAYQKLSELSYLPDQSDLGVIRNLAFETLVDGTGQRWNEDSAAELMKMYRKLEALS